MHFRLVFRSIPLIHLSVFKPIPCGFYYYSSVVELEFRDGDISRSYFISQVCFSYPGSFGFVFLYEVQYCFSKFCKELCWDFNWNCIEFKIAFCKMVIFTVLILPIHMVPKNMGGSFHLLISSSISFFKGLEVLVIQGFFTCFVRVTPRYFVLF